MSSSSRSVPPVRLSGTAAFPSDRLLGVAALCFYAIHAGQHVWHGRAGDALWACHVANAVLALAFLFAIPRGFGVALMWLVVGNGMWALYLADGGELAPTSLLTHVGGLLVALVGCARYGMAAGAWVAASLGLIALQILCRLLTAPAANVNVAWHAYGNWDAVFPSYPLYVTGIDLGAAALFWAIERGWRRWVG